VGGREVKERARFVGSDELKIVDGAVPGESRGEGCPRWVSVARAIQPKRSAEKRLRGYVPLRGADVLARDRAKSVRREKRERERSIVSL